MEAEKTISKARIYTPFGIAVKKRIIDLGITQSRLEKEVGAPYKYLTKMLRGERPGYQYLPLIAEYLDIDLEKLTG